MFMSAPAPPFYFQPADRYLTKEENGKVLDVLLDWLTTDRITLNQVDADEPEV